MTQIIKLYFLFLKILILNINRVLLNTSKTNSFFFTIILNLFINLMLKTKLKYCNLFNVQLKMYSIDN